VRFAGSSVKSHHGSFFNFLAPQPKRITKEQDKMVASIIKTLIKNCKQLGFLTFLRIFPTQI